MKIFAAAIGTDGPMQIDNGLFTQKYYVQAAAFLAKSKEEAIGKGILVAQEKWPVDDGYCNHFCVTATVPEEWTSKEISACR